MREFGPTWLAGAAINAIDSICAWCGRVRAGEDLWAPRGERTWQPGQVSHGLCPRCAAELLAETAVALRAES